MKWINFKIENKLGNQKNNQFQFIVINEMTWTVIGISTEFSHLYGEVLTLLFGVKTFAGDRFN